MSSASGDILNSSLGKALNSPSLSSHLQRKCNASFEHFQNVNARATEIHWLAQLMTCHKAALPFFLEQVVTPKYLETTLKIIGGGTNYEYDLKEKTNYIAMLYFNKRNTKHR
jgi:hypothetical protein